MAETNRIILGIDPGTNIMGYGLIGIAGKNARYIHMNVIRLTKIKDPWLKLKAIFEETCKVIDRYNPDELAIEAPFYGKNVQSMLKLGRAQGAAISAALSREIPVFEYAPRKIKMSITGKGAASKEQVAGILTNILSIKDMPENLDATDALAAALCHFFQEKAIVNEKSYKNWEDFVKKNPQKIK